MPAVRHDRKGVCIVNGVGSTSFFGYEGLRIIISGLIGVGLLWAASSTLSDAGLLDELTLALLVGFVIGLTLYFLELPDRSPSSRHPDPVVQFALAMDLPAGEYETANRYYVAFDTLLPQGLRERSQYFHQIYRIGFELILLGTIATQVVWLLYPYQRGPDRPVPPVVFAGVAALLALIALVPLHDSVRRAARKSAAVQRAALRMELRGVAGTVARELWLGSLVGVVLLVAARLLFDGVALVHEAVVGYLVWLWLRLHVFGLPGADRPNLLRHPRSVMTQRRRPPSDLSRYGGYLLLTVGGLSRITDFGGGYSLAAARPLARELWLWITAAVVVAAVIATRGHESGFTGTNYQQGSWFKDNAERVRAPDVVDVPAAGAIAGKRGADDS